MIEIDDSVPLPVQDETACGCAEGRRASTYSRRSVLAAAGAIGAAGVLASASSARFAFAAPDYAGDTVVVVSLRGGFDGLSAIAPVGDPAYFAARPNVAIPASKAIPLGGIFGLHPALSPLKKLWDDGVVAAVHAVGQTNPTRSHFAAMEDMENAAPGSHLRTGWIDRMIGLNATTTFSAVAMGTAAPSSLIGPAPELALSGIDQFTLDGAWNDTEVDRWTKALKGLHVGAPAAIAGPAAATLGALDTTMRLKAGGAAPAPGVTYPKGELGESLRDVARLMKAGVGLRAATIDVGNWDMHVAMGGVGEGWMTRQLTELGLALAAFHADLGDRATDLTLVTLSEFGRRVAENGSGGLDHGHGNVCLLMGGGVIGGKVYGRWPGLSKDNLDNGDLAGTTDYRTILAEVMEKRSRLSATSVFPGVATTRLGAFRVRS